MWEINRYKVRLANGRHVLLGDKSESLHVLRNFYQNGRIKLLFFSHKCPHQILDIGIQEIYKWDFKYATLKPIK